MGAYAHCHASFHNGTVSLLLINTAKENVSVSWDGSLGGTARFMLEAASPASRRVSLNGGALLKLAPDGVCLQSLTHLEAGTQLIISSWHRSLMDLWCCPRLTPKPAERQP